MVKQRRLVNTSKLSVTLRYLGRLFLGESIRAIRRIDYRLSSAKQLKKVLTIERTSLWWRLTILKKRAPLITVLELIFWLDYDFFGLFDRFATYCHRSRSFWSGLTVITSKTDWKIILDIKPIFRTSWSLDHGFLAGFQLFLTVLMFWVVFGVR